MIIYKAVNKLNGMSYIGQTVRTLDERRKCHERVDDKSYFQNAIEKYGSDNFEWEVLCECSSAEEMNEMEMFYIEEFSSLRPNGYNLTKGGEGSYWTGDNNPAKLDHIREKISKAITGNERPDLSERNRGNTGKTYEEIYGEDQAKRIRAHRSAATQGKYNANYGNTVTEENKATQRQKMAKYEYSIIDPDGNKYLGISLRELCKEHNLNRGSMMRILNTGKNVKGWRCYGFVYTREIGIEIGLM